MLQKIQDPYSFEKRTIEGVPVYFKNLPWSPCVHIGIGIKKGSMSDPEGKEGLAHFLEHMAFTSSPLFLNQKELWKFRKRFTLDTLNARTGFWYTEYTAKCLPTHFTKTLTGIFDMVFRPLLQESDISRERRIIIQEAWDRLRNKKYEKYLKAWLHNTQPNLPTKRMYTAIGWPETVAKITRNDLSGWHKKNYHRGNMYILLAGNISTKNIDVLRNLIGEVKKGPTFKNIKRNIPVKSPITKKRILDSEEMGFKQDHASFSIYINRKRDMMNEEITTLAEELLYAVSFEVLRQDLGLCYGVHVDISPDINFISNEIGLNLNPKGLAQAEAKIFEIIADIGKGKYIGKFEEEKRLSIENMQAAERTAQAIIRTVSTQLIYDQAITPMSGTIRDREKVTYDEVAKYITDTFKKENVYIETILP